MINDLILRPGWFIGTESLFDIISMFITFFIFLYSYKVYKLASNKNYFYLSVGFFSISLGFLFKVISNSVILYPQFSDLILNVLSFLRPTYIYTASLLLYSFLVLTGYLIIVCLTLKIKSNKIRLLLMLLVLLASILPRQERTFTFFHFFAFLLLSVYIVPYMHKNYKKQKTNSSFLVFLSFLLLTIANFALIGVSSYGITFYIIGQSISLLAYIILLINLIALGLRK